MSKLKEKLMLSEKGYSDLKKAITACTITNIALLLPSMVACLLFWELLKPFTGETISWAALWKLLGLGLVAAILVFLAAKNDYRKTYIASYKEASTFSAPLITVISSGSAVTIPVHRRDHYH